MKKRINIEKGLIKPLFSLALPIIIANVLQVAYQFTDSFWVGRLGAGAVATTTVTGTIIFLTISIGSGFSIAGSILISQYYGAKNTKMVSKIAAQSLLMIIITSIILGGLGFIFSGSIINLIGVEKDIFNQTLIFLRLSFLSLVFNFSFFMFQAIMRGIGKANIPIYIVLFTVLLNFLLDPLFIFGYSFIPSFGVVGAAIATISTQFLASLIGFFILFKGSYNIKTSIKDYIPDFSIIKRSFFLGLPSSIEMVARSSSFVIMTSLVTAFGTVALAAYGIAGNLIQFAVIISMGLSMATSVLVGQNVGASKIKTAQSITKIGVITSFLVMSFLGLIMYLGAPYFINFFVPGDAEVMKIGTQFLHITSMFFGFIGIQMAIIGTLRAIGKTTIPMLITIFVQLIFKTILAYSLSKIAFFGITGIWWADPIANILACIILFIVIVKTDWSKSNLTKKEEVRKDVIEESIIEEGIRR